MDIALVDPEIPQNAGCVARMCAASGLRLHLVGTISFSLDDRYLKRAGLDYWHDVCVGVHKDLESFMSSQEGRPIYFFSKRSHQYYPAIRHTNSDILVFGSESKGLPKHILEKYDSQVYGIPLRPGVRSLNLSGAVHVIAYHALASMGFPGIL